MTNKNPLLSDSIHLWYPITLPKSKIELEVKPYGLKDNKILSTILQEAEAKNDFKIFFGGLINTMQSAIKPNDSGDIFDIKSLHMSDFIFLSNKVRAISKGSMIKYKVKCGNKEFKTDNKIEKCEHTNIVEFDIENYELINDDEHTNIVNIKIEGPQEKNFNIYMKDLTVDLIYKNPDMINKTDDIEEMVKLLASFIDFITIVVGQDEKKFDSLTNEMIVEFLMELIEPQLRPLVEWFHNIPRLILRKEYVCAKCNKKQEIVIDDMLSFLK